MDISDFHCETGSVGVTTGGARAVASAIARVRERGWSHIDVLDVCSGVGTIGLLMLDTLGVEIMRTLTLTDINPFNVRSAERTVAAYGFINVRVLLGDSLETIRGQRFHLIVSNPPHWWNDDRAALTDTGRMANALGSNDPDWHFHRAFFASVHQYLHIGGEAWLIEHGGAGTNTLAHETVDKSRIDITGWSVEPNDPEFSWLLLRRRV